MNVCRVCLRSAGVYYKMYSVQEGLQLGEILKLCVPEVDLSLSKLPVLCETCMGLLSAAYTLRKTCLKTESQINEYLRLNKSNETPLTVVELKDLVQAVYKNVEPPPPLIQRLGQPEGVTTDFDKALPKLTPIQPKSFMNVPNSASYLVQNTSSEASIMPVCVQAPLIVCGITNSTSDMKNSTSVVPALVLSPSKATQSIDSTVSSSTTKQGAPPKAKRTRAKRNTQEESSSKSIDAKSSFCTIDNVVSLHNETEEKKELDVADKTETAKESVISQPDSSKESSIPAGGPPKDDTNTAVEQTSSEESRNENSQEASNPVASDDKAADSDDVIITGFGNTEPVVITDDEDDDVQVVSETKLSNDVGSLLKNTPRIENMDVPELVSVTRVDPVNPPQQSSRGGNRRFFTGQSGPSTSNSNSAKNSSTEPKPIKVVNPKTNQVQIIGYILNPDSQAARKASSINSRQRSISKPFSVSENRNTPNVSVSKPSTVTPVKSTSSVQSTENILKQTDIKQESSVTDSNLSKKSDHILPDRGPESEDEDNPDYVSVADLRPKDTNEASNESTVRVKREVPSDDEDSSTSHSAKKQKTSNSVSDTTSENPLHMVPFVKLEPIDTSELMRQDALEAVDPLSTFGQDSVDSPKVQDDSDPDYSPDILDLIPSPPGSPADRPKRRNKPPARYSENPEEGKKRRRRSKKAQQPEDATAAAPDAAIAAAPAAETSTSTSTKKKGRPKKSDTQQTEPEVETVIGQAGVYHFLSDFNLASQPEPKKRGRKKKQANVEQETPSVGLFHSLFGDIAETLPAADIHGDLTNTSSQYSSGIYGENLELDASMSNSENARLGMDENSEKNPIDTCQNSNLENDQVDISQNSNLERDQVDVCQNSNLEIDPADSRSHTSISVGDENTQNAAYDGNSQIQRDQDATADPLNNDNAVDDPLNNDSVSSNNMNKDEFVPSAENSVSNSISALSEDRKTSDEASEHCDKVDVLAAVGDEEEEEEEEVVDVPEFVSLDVLQGS